MATTVNLGSQYITFDFRHPAKGADFNRILRHLIKPGIYTGFVATNPSANTVNISAGTMWADAYDLNRLADNLAVHCEAQSSISLTVNQTLAGENEVLYFYYEYTEVIDNYFAVLHTNKTNFTATAPPNAIVVCEITYDGLGNITGFDTTTRTLGLWDDTYNAVIQHLATFYDVTTFQKYINLTGGFYIRDTTLNQNLTVPSGKQMVVVGDFDTSAYTLTVPVDASLIVIDKTEAIYVPAASVGNAQVINASLTKAKMAYNAVAVDDLSLSGLVTVDYSRIGNGPVRGTVTLTPSSSYVVTGATIVVANSTYVATDTDRNKSISCVGNTIYNNSSTITITVQYIGLP